MEPSQPEIQQLRIAAAYKREVQSIVIKAFAEDGSASQPTSEVAEQQLVTVEVCRPVQRNDRRIDDIKYVVQLKRFLVSI